MNLIFLSLKSAWHRKTGVFLAILSIALSILLLLGVDQIIKETKKKFLKTISQTDLIVGARGGPINLLLYSVFHVGGATNNISYKSFETIKNYDSVGWAVPVSLGDSHRGFRVVGTDQNFFHFFRYGDRKELKMQSGKIFDDLYDVVLGHEVANRLHYTLAQPIVVTHGISQTTGIKHKNKPFRVSGILKPTGTPVDRAVYISLEGFEAIHIDWQSGAPSVIQISAENARKFSLKSKQITAFFVGLKHRNQTFRLQRAINNFSGEPLTAILPGVVLVQFWKNFEDFERVLVGISFMVLFSGLVGVFITLFSTLNERRREIAILKTLGVNRIQICGLFAGESFLITLMGSIIGIILLYVSLFFLRDEIADLYGVFLPINPLDLRQLLFVSAIVFGGALSGLIPAEVAYRRSLKDGLTTQI